MSGGISSTHIDVTGRRMSNDASIEPTIINIPIPKITETELEIVHVFPPENTSPNGN